MTATVLLEDARPTVALDFDGVICDSMTECMLVAFGAYSEWNEGIAESITTDTALPKPFLEYFHRHRHLVRPAREYWAIVDAYYRGADPLVPATFERLCRDHQEQMAEFEPLYFHTRERLREKDFAGWLRLHRLYEEFGQSWPLLAKATVPYVVTTRDRASLGCLLEFFGIEIAPERWWTKERFLSKEEAIADIALERGLSSANITFVDDHPDHLRDVSTTGAAVFWAEWGFWPPDQGDAAAYERIRSMEEFVNRLRLND